MQTDFSVKMKSSGILYSRAIMTMYPKVPFLFSYRLLSSFIPGCISQSIDSETQYILEVAAITHDIACPLCREKYGNTNGKHQEEEGVPLVKAFLSDSGMTEAQIERVAFLVGHHHTFEEIDGLDWQILIEADYIANATENGYSKENVKGFIQRIMKTESGIRLAHAVFCL